MSASRSQVGVAFRRAVRPVLFRATELVWTGLAWAAGALLHLTPRLLRVAASDRVLVIAPHPDDETLGCAGAICRHLAAGAQVTIAVVTDGSRSRAGGLAPGEMKARRQSEAEQAAKALAGGRPLQLRQLGLAEGSWEPAEGEEHLAVLIREVQPTVIYTTSLVDFHPEHIGVARALGEALAQEARELFPQPRIRAYELQVPLTPLLTNVVSPLGAQTEHQRLALAAYVTQRGSFSWLRRHKRYLSAIYRSETPVEAFLEVTHQTFTELHRVERGGMGVFRSIRLRPFSDPLAWTVGIRARLRIRRFLRARGEQ